MNDKRALNELNKISDLAHKYDIKLRIGLQCAWGRNNKINIQKITNKIDKILSMDPYKICLADTAGFAKSDTIKKYLEKIIPLIKDKSLVMHFHQTQRGWQENVYAAIEMGIREFDSSLGGEGGSPFLHRSKGNIPTEELVKLIDEKGYHSGVDQSGIEKTVLKLNRIINKIPTSTIV